MKEKVTIQGRSLILNIVLIALNLTGFTLLAMGFHEAFLESKIVLSISGGLLIVMTSLGLLLFKGTLMMSGVSRILVGGLLIVSGLVKANDPLGFSYKLEEYFEDGALAYRIKEWFSSPEFSLEFFIDYALLLSVIICIVEIVLGVLVILGGKIKVSSFLLVFMMGFFTFLTWHTASCDKDIKFLDRDEFSWSDPEEKLMAQTKLNQSEHNQEITIVLNNKKSLIVDEMKSPQCVDDCGCFGDALKGSVGRSLTPKESLWKDLTLLYLIFWIFIAQRHIKPNNRVQNIIFTITSLIVILFFSMVFGWYFPLLFGAISLLGSLWLMRTGGKFIGNFYGVIAFVVLLCLMMTTYVLMYQPIKDYRAYAVGSNLHQNMNNGVEGQIQTFLIYENKKTKEQREFDGTSADYMNSKIWEQSDWEYKEQNEKVIVQMILPSIDSNQFNPFLNIENITKDELLIPQIKQIVASSRVQALILSDVNSNDQYEVMVNEYNSIDYPEETYSIIDTIIVTDPNITEVSLQKTILNSETIVLVSSKNLSEADWSHIDNLKSIQKECLSNNIPMAIITSASLDEITEFKKVNNFNIPIFLNDGIELKAMARSNPTLFIIKKGIVVGKYPQRSTPKLKTFKNKYLD